MDSEKNLKMETFDSDFIEFKCESHGCEEEPNVDPVDHKCNKNDPNMETCDFDFFECKSEPFGSDEETNIDSLASPSLKDCPICHEEYDDEERCPRSLPCSHTFCTKCIENLISRNSKICPFCLRGFKASNSRDFGMNISLLDVLKHLRESAQPVPSPCVGEAGKHSNRVNNLKRETDEVINKLFDSVQEADDEIDRNLQSNEKLENSLIHVNEIISDLLTENVKRIEYLREQSRRLKSHKISINETRNILRTAKNKLTSAGTFIQITEVADDVKSRKTDTEKHLPNFMVHMAEDEKTLLKLVKVVNLTRDPIEKLKKIVKSSGMNDEFNFIPDMNNLKIRDVIPQVTIECLQSRSHSIMEQIKKGQIFGVQELKERKRYAQITLDDSNRICLHYLKEQNIPPEAHLLKHSDILKLLDVSSRLVFLELSEKELLGRIYIHLSPQTKRADQFALLCSGEKGVSYVQSNLLDTYFFGTDYQRVQCGDYKNFGGKALVPDACNEKGGVFKRPLRAGLIQGRGPLASPTEGSQFFIYTNDGPEVERDYCFGMVEEGLSILQRTIANYLDTRRVVVTDAGMVLPI